MATSDFDEDDAKLLAGCGLLVSFIPMVVCGTAIDAFVARKVWGWLIAIEYGLPQLSWSVAIGAGLLMTLWTPAPGSKGKSIWEVWGNVIGSILFKPAIVLAIGFAAAVILH